MKNTKPVLEFSELFKELATELLRELTFPEARLVHSVFGQI